MSEILATLEDKITVYRHLVREGKAVRVLVYHDIPCGLSRSAQTRSPTPLSVSNIAPQTSYRLTLFLMPNITLCLGDDLEITQQGKVFSATASDSFGYSTHTVCVVTIERREEGLDD